VLSNHIGFCDDKPTERAVVRSKRHEDEPAFVEDPEVVIRQIELVCLRSEQIPDVLAGLDRLPSATERVPDVLRQRLGNDAHPLICPAVRDVLPDLAQPRPPRLHVLSVLLHPIAPSGDIQPFRLDVVPVPNLQPARRALEAGEQFLELPAVK
jgi:hypothetical protein